MTLETCKAQFESAKVREDAEAMAFWEARARSKVSRHEKYKDIDINEFLGIKETKSKKGK